MTTTASAPRRASARHRATAGAVAALLLATLSAGAAVGQPAPKDALGEAVEALTAAGVGGGSCLFGARRSLGIWPFEDDKVPVAPRAAQRVYEELLSRMLAQRWGCVDILDGSAIGVVVQHLARSGALQKSAGSVVAALEEANRRVDVVVFPSLYTQAGRTVLTLKAVERASGRTLAATQPVRVPDGYLVADIADLAVGLDAAVNRAAHQFALQVPDLREVRPVGVFFAESGAQPQAGRYLLERLTTALGAEVANPVSGRTLRIRDVAVTPPRAPQAPVEAATLEPAPAGEGPVYDLTGRYWVRGEAVDLKVTLRRGDGATYAWSGRIQAGDFRDLALRPVNAAAAAAPAAGAPFAFQLTSPRGDAPLYKPGEDLELFLRTGRDAFVYCFYVDTAGAVATVLPNPHRPETPRFTAGTLHLLPDPAHDPFRFVFTADTAGEEMVACFATTRDVKGDLPRELFPNEIAPTPGLTLGRLRETFAGLADTTVAEAVVTVTVDH